MTARLQQAIDTLEPERFDLAGDNHRSAGNGILDYANAVLRGQPASLPEAVRDLHLPPPCHARATHPPGHPVSSRPSSAAQLGRLPTIAVLAPSSAFAAGDLRSDLRGPADAPTAVLPAVDHELVWDPGLSAAAGFVVASILEWPALTPAEAITGDAAQHRRLLPGQARRQGLQRPRDRPSPPPRTRSRHS